MAVFCVAQDPDISFNEYASANDDNDDNDDGGLMPTDLRNTISAQMNSGESESVSPNAKVFKRGETEHYEEMQADLRSNPNTTDGDTQRVCC